MDISKTQFKRYTKCGTYYPLDKIYYTHSLDDEDIDNIKHVLEVMFSDAGDDLVKLPDEKLEAFLEYYKETERLALEEASRTFGKVFEYKESTKEQKSFSISDTHGNTLYTYLDGYNEDDDEIIVVEVKATTSKKFVELGYTKDKKLNPLFEKNDNIISLKKELSEKDYKVLEKLYNKDSDAGKYIYDLGITKYIVSQSLKRNNVKKRVKYYLGILNSSYIKDVNQEKLICFVDCTSILDSYDEIIKADYDRLVSVLNKPSLDNKKYENKCKSCEYFKICHESLNVKNSILKLIGKSKKVGDKTLEDLVNEGKTKLIDIPYDELTNINQIIQRDVIDSHNEYINKDKIKKLIDTIEYPIYHLDFEGLNLPIPRFKGEKPYTQSLFQFSIHIERSPGVCDYEKDHYSFLPDDFEDHREDLIKEMIRIIDLSKGGSVMVYNKGYESPAINKLARIFKEYEDELKLIDSKIVDLLDIVRGEVKTGVNFYHEDLEGSFSIKKVLPVFSKLSYKELDVQNGNEAMIAYSSFKHLPKEDIELKRQELIKYCGLDTYSMFIILNELRGRILWLTKKI